jgi:hypothetical protein
VRDLQRRSDKALLLAEIDSFAISPRIAVLRQFFATVLDWEGDW